MGSNTKGAFVFGLHVWVETTSFGRGVRFLKKNSTQKGRFYFPLPALPGKVGRIRWTLVELRDFQRDQGFVHNSIKKKHFTYTSCKLLDLVEPQRNHNGTAFVHLPLPSTSIGRGTLLYSTR